MQKLKFFFLLNTVLIAVFLPLTVECAGKSKTGFNSKYECYVDTKGNDWFWYCGPQSKGCNGVSERGNDKHKQMKDGEDFEYGDSGHWWCCVDDPDKAGRFRQGDSWIVKTTPVMETFYDDEGNLIGKCEWNKETNICGRDSDNKCTKPNMGCGPKYVQRGEPNQNGKDTRRCVKRCASSDFELNDNDICVLITPDGTAITEEDYINTPRCEESGYGWLGPGKTNCDKCTGADGRFGITSDRICKRCEVGQLYNKEQEDCITATIITKDMLMFGVDNETCWQLAGQSNYKDCVLKGLPTKTAEKKNNADTNPSNVSSNNAGIEKFNNSNMLKKSQLLQALKEK